MRRWASRDAREIFWDGLDFLDQNPKLRRGLYVGVPLATLAIVAGFWGYAQWSRTHAIAIGRQWLAAGKLDRAEIAIKDALSAAPDAPESWQLAAALAWKRGMKAQAVDDLRKAAFLSHDLADAVIAWAEAAILADDSDEAGRALSLLAPGELSRSARAERAKGEWLRRKGAYGEAAERFQAALDLDRHASVPSLAFDEVPLGVTLLSTGKAGDHKRGVELLSLWSSDPTWGAQALRELLADAIRHNDNLAMPRWAEALSRHPRFSVGDIYACLQGTTDSDPPRFQAMLRSLKEASGSNPERVAQVMGSLNRLGRAAETLEWAKTIPSEVSQRPPIAVAVAEALRLSGQWRELDLYVSRCEWGHDLEFIHWLYGLIAAKHLGDSAKAQAMLKTIQSFSHWNGGQALVAGDMLYGWAADDDAITLLWSASESQSPGFAVQALGTLARIYQVKRDADGQYRVFARLTSLRPEDKDFGNNFAYFAVVTDRGNPTTVARMAQANFEAKPDNIYYRSTWALVLCWLSRPSEAMRVMEPVASTWRTSRAVAWAYGATLAGMGRKDEAQEVFRSINPDTLSFQEIDWVSRTLK
jgi:tetratricopeptide (TPR) repeat protein